MRLKTFWFCPHCKRYNEKRIDHRPPHHKWCAKRSEYVGGLFGPFEDCTEGKYSRQAKKTILTAGGTL